MSSFVADAGRLFAALDLGTNTCRLLVVETMPGAGFRVVDSFSQIVRLGEGLAATGRLSAPAMERAIAALSICAGRLARVPGARARCIATEACRAAANAAEFLNLVEARTGLRLEVIDHAEEARLAALGCSALIDPAAAAALVVDVGGGSTELVFVDPAEPGVPTAWVSLPFGVVTLAEATQCQGLMLEAMIAQVQTAAAAISPPPAVRDAYAAAHSHMIGCSGAATALAGLHLDLQRYDRARVDGLWLSRADIARGVARIESMGIAGLAAHPSVGPGRADLVAPGAAILEGVMRAWPAARMRVADRGVREGILLTLIGEA